MNSLGLILSLEQHSSSLTPGHAWAQTKHYITPLMEKSMEAHTPAIPSVRALADSHHCNKPPKLHHPLPSALCHIHRRYRILSHHPCFHCLYCQAVGSLQASPVTSPDRIEIAGSRFLLSKIEAACVDQHPIPVAIPTCQNCIIICSRAAASPTRL